MTTRTYELEFMMGLEHELVRVWRAAADELVAGGHVVADQHVVDDAAVVVTDNLEQSERAGANPIKHFLGEIL